MSEFKSLDDVIGYLTNVAEFELRHTEHIKIPDGHMTVISENYNIMFDAIQWITEKLEQPQLNDNQQIVIDLEMSDCYVEVAGWNYPEELDTENLRYLFNDVLENARALEQEEE